MLANYQSLIGGEWFQHAAEDRVPEFLRILLQMKRTRLIQRTEEESLREKIEEFTKKHHEQLIAEAASWRIREAPGTLRESIRIA